MFLDLLGGITPIITKVLSYIPDPAARQAAARLVQAGRKRVQCGSGAGAAYLVFRNAISLIAGYLGIYWPKATFCTWKWQFLTFKSCRKTVFAPLEALRSYF